MKKLILLALVAVIMAACQSEQQQKIKNDICKEGDSIVIIDSCEYIVNTEYYAYAYTTARFETYTHKGNCRFCKERREKELKEIIELIKAK